MAASAPEDAFNGHAMGEKPRHNTFNRGGQCISSQPEEVSLAFGHHHVVDSPVGLVGRHGFSWGQQLLFQGETD